MQSLLRHSKLKAHCYTRYNSRAVARNSRNVWCQKDMEVEYGFVIRHYPDVLYSKGAIFANGLNNARTGICNISSYLM